MAESFMTSCYQAEFGFASEQIGIIRRIERVIFSEKPKTDRTLRAGDEPAGEGEADGGVVEH